MNLVLQNIMKNWDYKYSCKQQCRAPSQSVSTEIDCSWTQWRHASTASTSHRRCASCCWSTCVCTYTCILQLLISVIVSFKLNQRILFGYYKGLLSPNSHFWSHILPHNCKLICQDRLSSQDSPSSYALTLDLYCFICNLQL